MPNIKSAKKRMRLSRVQNTRNRQARARLRTAIKKVRNAETAADAAAAYREVQTLLDRAGASNLMHPNKSARLKGQLARHVNSLS